MVVGTVQNVLLGQVVVHDPCGEEEAGLDGTNHGEGGTAATLSLVKRNLLIGADISNSCPLEEGVSTSIHMYDLLETGLM